MTNQENKALDNWERGKNALERIMKHIPVSKIEKLADKIEDQNFRSGIQFKIFINSL